jgi:hypothetical protein
VRLIRETGQGRYAVEPSSQGPHCKAVVVFARPNHSGMDPNYICLGRAVTEVEATLTPVVKIALCN